MNLSHSFTSALTRYIFIDPTAQVVKWRSVSLHASAMCNIIGSRSLEAIPLPGGDTLWFDGEPVEYHVCLDGFAIAGTPVLGSRAMILGPDDPGTEMPGSCRMSRAEALALIEWMPQRRIVGETFTQTPAGGVIAYLFDPA
jgi:hypothetical protein